MRAKLAVRSTVVRLVPVWTCLAIFGCDPGGADAPSSLSNGTGGVIAASAGGQGVGGEGTGGQGVGGQGMGGQGVGGQGMGGGPATCEPAPRGPCPTGWVVNLSTVCGMGGNGGITCGATEGDGLCYKRCTGDASCTDTCFPHCVQHGLFMSSDAGELVSFCEP